MVKNKNIPRLNIAKGFPVFIWVAGIFLTLLPLFFTFRAIKYNGDLNPYYIIILLIGSLILFLPRLSVNLINVFLKRTFHIDIGLEKNIIKQETIDLQSNIESTLKNIDIQLGRIDSRFNEIYAITNRNSVFIYIIAFALLVFIARTLILDIDRKRNSGIIMENEIASLVNSVQIDKSTTDHIINTVVKVRNYDGLFKYNSPPIRETAQLLDTLSKSLKICNYDSTIDNFYKNLNLQEDLQILAKKEIWTEDFLRQYSYLFALRGWIALEASSYGEKKEPAFVAENYFDLALKLNDSCAFAINGEGNILYLKNSNMDSIDKNYFVNYNLIIDKYTKANKFSDYSYTEARKLNNIVNTNLDFGLKCFNKKIDDSVYDISGAHNIISKCTKDNSKAFFKDNFKMIRQVLELSKSVSTYRITSAQIYALYAKYIIINKLTDDQIEDMSKNVFIFEKGNRIVDLNTALDRSKDYIVRALELGFCKYIIFNDKGLKKNFFNVFAESGIKYNGMTYNNFIQNMIKEYDETFVAYDYQLDDSTYFCMK